MLVALSPHPVNAKVCGASALGHRGQVAEHAVLDAQMQRAAREQPSPNVEHPVGRARFERAHQAHGGGSGLGHHKTNQAVLSEAVARFDRQADVPVSQAQ